MADRYIRWDDVNNRYAQRQAVTQSAGAGDAGKIAALDSTGKFDISVIPGVAIEQIEASESISAGDALNIWDDAGTRKVRLADATIGRPAHTFARTGGAAGAMITVDDDGPVSVSGVVLGSRYWLGAAGTITTNPDETTSGAVIQSVGYGRDTGILAVDIEPPVYVD